MRFLLHATSISAATVKPTKFKWSAAKSQSPILAPKVKAGHAGGVSLQDGTMSSRLPRTETERAAATHKRWGQQCGVSCGCVLRLEVELDARDRVVSAQATTKRILATQSPFHANNANNANANNAIDSNVLTPILNRKGRPQCTSPSPCDTLSRLARVVVAYMPGRYLWQLQNYAEYSSHQRSSLDFCHALLHPMVPEPKPTVPTRAVSLSTRQEQLAMTSGISGGTVPTALPAATNTWMTYTPCWDVVEDALTALLKGHIAAARPPLNVSHKGSTVPSSVSQDHWLLAQTDEAERCTTTESTSWIESLRQLAWGQDASATHGHNTVPELSPWIPLPQPSAGSRSRAQRVGSAVHLTSHQSHTFTALDWMDWAEQERLLVEQVSNKWTPKFSDWISYVDAFNREQQEQRRQWRHEQSA